MKADRFYRHFFFALIAVVAIIILYQARSLLTPVLTGLLVAYILYPVITFATKVGIRKGFAIFVLFVGISLGLFYSAVILIPAVHQQVKALVVGFFEFIPPADLPESAQGESGSILEVAGEDISVADSVTPFEGSVDASSPTSPALAAAPPVTTPAAVPSLLADVTDGIVDDSVGVAAGPLSAWQQRVIDSPIVAKIVSFSATLHQHGIVKQPLQPRQIIATLSGWVGAGLLLPAVQQWDTVVASIGGVAKDAVQFLLIALMVLIFALLDGPKINKGAMQLIPNSIYEPGAFILRKTTDMFGYYLRGLIVENLIMGIISLLMLVVVCFISELTFVMALVIALIIGLTNVIRIIGPFVGAGVGLLLVLVTSTDPVAMLGILIVVSIVQLIDSLVILPLVMKEQVQIHPVFCVLGILVGGAIGGVMGMILAIPVMGGIKVAYRILSVEMKKFNMDPEPVADYAAEAFYRP
ncbi:MAG: putative PurR-regulated permease PerM [Rhodothermales bacterium]|jgi:predicted PurR-regulated permease PerM